MIVCLVAAIVAALVYVGLCDPEVYPAPRCFFKAATGYDCPGCGSQRAFHALVHGRPADAWHYNAALFFAVPLAALYLWRPRCLRRVLDSPTLAVAVAVAIVAWWIGRNVL